MEPKMTAPDAAAFLQITGQAISKRLKQRSLAHKKAQNRVYWGHETSKVIFNINFQQKIVAVQIVKGGTGKTTLTFSIAVRASLYGARVLCVDLDQQANLTRAFGVNSENIPVMVDVIKGAAKFTEGIVEVADGLHLFASRMENAVLENILMVEGHPADRVYKDILDPLRKNYDLILIDCAPALGLSVAATALASDYVLCPVIPDEFSMSGLNISWEEFMRIEKKYKKKVPLKIILNKFDTRTILSHEILANLIGDKRYRNCLFKTSIRQSQDFPNAYFKKLSIFDSIKPSPTKDDIDLVTREVLDLLPKDTSRSFKTTDNQVEI